MIKGTTHRVWFVVSVLLGMWLIAYTWHWAIFLFGTISITLCIYFAGLYVVRTIHSLKISNYKKALKFVAIVFILVSIIPVLWIGAIGSGAFSGLPIPHLRTNVFTGECSVNDWVERSDPWFYKRGCDVPTAKKIQLLRNYHSFDFVKQQCGHQLLKWEEVTCKDLLKTI